MHRIINNVLLLLVSFTLLTIGISYYHPIFKKWVFQTARYIGRPIPARIYTDGKLNKDIKLFHTNRYWGDEQADYYIILFPRTNDSMCDNIFILNRGENCAGRVCTNNECYDLIAGRLFQSDMGANYRKFTDDMKGFDFDPEISFTNSKITFNMPQRAGTYKCDSVRIEL